MKRTIKRGRRDNDSYAKGCADGHIEGYRRGEKAGMEQVRSALMAALGLEEMILFPDMNHPLSGRTIYVRKSGEHP